MQTHEWFMAAALILFVLGIYTCLAKRNAVGILMGIELVLNAAALNFITFSHFRGGEISGHVMALFIIVLAAAEAVVALALLLAIRRKFATIDLLKVDTLKH